ncbi:MAG TPA: hypothetical protein VHO23_00960 [Candidatus Paceibacterota bacterium]|nr:hypothetical protein [Candidatus Paceibacterota bacterium]
MDTNKKMKMAWAAAGVLAVLLIVVTFLWIRAQNDLDRVLDNGREDIEAARDRIDAACEGPDASSNAECREALDDLADVLRDFSQNLEDATSSAPAVPAAE